ncbi:MAG: PA0069 family radical SAM protein [Phycisphaeraceae bacterium]
MAQRGDQPKPGEPAEYVDGLAEGAGRGRGAGLNPGNRFEDVRLHVLGEYLDHRAQEEGAEGERCEQGEGEHRYQTQVLTDTSRTIINYVDPDKSPDIGMRWTINPYRGCEHGCIYCYARPTHEYLGMSSGLDFETKIFAKRQAPTMLRRELAHPKWRGEPIVMSGVTDPYQPIERKLRITRGCLEVLAECRQPVGIITKNRLVLRDLDLLTELARHGAVSVSFSITTLDASLAQRMEPRTSHPRDRLKTVRRLRDAGVPVGVMVAPIVPGLNDREIPAVLQAAAEAGAQGAGYVLLRLPHQLKALFLDWLGREFPERASHVESLLRGARGGKLYDATHGERGRGTGPVAEQVGRMFRVYARRHGLDGRRGRGLSGAAFRPPRKEADGQMNLFG